MTYKITPDTIRPAASGAKYPWGQMGDGDSITVIEPYVKGRGSSAGSSAASWVKRNAPEYEVQTWRIYDEDGAPTDEVVVAFYLREGEEDGEDV